ncbi:tetratricopeptide repeat protein [Streptomyces sp. NPDC051665]|uniref:tetratricopeptide repeat protein n=1 Tax=Streptomyces sp. NPDC051665 TaxID=3154647 RepID=UPI00341AE82B
MSGLGGIGKTSLALCAAHKAVKDGWFPGGTLFVDFRGYDEDPVTADQAVVALLDGMGVRGTDLPQTVAGQYGLYRRLLAEERRSMLLVLDNASDAGQVMPLVPGTDHHRVLVTSRDRLTELDAQLIDLDVLNAEDATDLIDRSLRLSDRGDDRATREPAAVSELATLCGHHPLALRVTAGMLRKRRHRPVASLVNDLRGAEDVTAAVGLRPVFEAAYRQLPSEQARLLRLLALAPAAEVGGETAAAMADLGVDRTFTLLEELAAAHLVTPVPGGADVRWRLHDLVRVFGVYVVEGDAGFREEGEVARGRVLAFYLRWARAADDRLQWLPEMPEPERFVDRAGALAWLDSERAGLVGAVQWAREERYADTAVRLSQCLAEYLDWRRSFGDWITVCGVAREAAHRAGNQVGEAIALNNLGLALEQTGRVKEAIAAHTHARDLHQTAGDGPREASAWDNLGIDLRKAGRTKEAIAAHTHARDLFHAVGDRRGEARAWNNLGATLRATGCMEEAITARTHARDLYQAVGDRRGEAIAWNNLGATLRAMGRVEVAIEAYGKALEGYREIDDWYETGRTLYNLAHAHRYATRPAEARTHYRQSADAYTRANAPTEAALAQSHADALT